MLNHFIYLPSFLLSAKITSIWAQKKTDISYMMMRERRKEAGGGGGLVEYSSCNSSVCVVIVWGFVLFTVEVGLVCGGGERGGAPICTFSACHRFFVSFDARLGST